jgi:hypothetical protein
MDARSVWFRETGEGRPKEQLLIETMFCVYYLSKSSAVRVTYALHLQPPFLNTFSSSVPSCGSRTSPVGHRQRVSRPARQPAMAFAAKVAVQPPLSVAMTKLTVNRLAHALDDLASLMDIDQFALASMSEDHKEGVEAFLERHKPRFKGR